MLPAFTQDLQNDGFAVRVCRKRAADPKAFGHL